MDNVPAAAFMKDTAGHYVYVNRLFHRITERGGISWLGHTDEEFLPPEVARKLRALDAEVLASGRATEAVEEVPTPDGAPHRWMVCKFPVQGAAGETYLGGVAIDITEHLRVSEELVESERRFREMLENVRLAAVMMDERGTVLFCNDFFLRLTGWHRDEVLGHDWFGEFLPPDEGARMRPEFERWVRRGSMPGHDEHPIRTRDRGQRLLAWSHTPLRDRGGRVVGMTCLGEDITDRRRLQEEALKSSRLESLGVLAGGIAHDFNNILTAVLGNILLLKAGGDLDATAVRRLEESERACLRARLLTQQILTFSRGGEPLKRVLDLEPLLREAAATVPPESSARCELSFAAGLWPVEADPGQMRQALDNVIANARQAMPAGGVIRITAENLPPASAGDTADGHPPRPRVRITIGDEGPGIPAAHLPKIFDPYFTTRPEGGGLGLSVAYSVVSRHGGLIAASSPPGSGALIAITLPAVPGAGAAAARAVEGAPASAGARILVMDDESLIRDVLGGMLEHLGYRPEFAADGAAAIALYHRALEEGRPFSAVIFDLTVPGGVGGAEAIQALRALDPSVRAIVASGYSGDPVMADHREHGFSAVLAKPFRIEDLEAALREAFGPPR